MSTYAKLRTDLVSAPAEIDGQTVYNIKDPITGNYFRLREPEFWLISQLDGKTSYDELNIRFRDKFGMEIGVENIQKFVTLLEQKFFLEDQRAEQAVSRKSYGRDDKNSLFSRLLSVRIKAFNPGPMLDVVTKFYRPFHRPFWLTIELIFIVYAIGILMANA